MRIPATRGCNGSCPIRAPTHRECVVGVRIPAHWSWPEGVYGQHVEESVVALGKMTPISDEEEALPSDEEEALRARVHYRESGIPSIGPDPRVDHLLGREERLLGVREAAVLRKIDVEDEAGTVLQEEGPLFATDQRLLQLGDYVESIRLLDIDELTMADDRILVTLTGSRGVTLDVAEPQQFRVLIAAAKAALRARTEADRPL
jgi:hypothetical protein